MPDAAARRMTMSSITRVLTIIGHAQRRPCGMVARMCSPAGPASCRAYGSRNRASGRSLSMARYMAHQRAVAETLLMGLPEDELVMARQNVTTATIFRRLG